MLIKTRYRTEVSANKETDLAGTSSADQIGESEFEAMLGSGSANYW